MSAWTWYSAAVDGDPRTTKAVIYDASFDYEIGTFDGKEFHTEYGPYQAGGGNFYAAQTFNNNRDNRVVQIGWMRGGPNSAEKYGVPFNQQMSFPYELTLRSIGDEVRLFASPIEEINSLVNSLLFAEDADLREGENLLADERPFDLIDMEIEFSPGTAQKIVFQLARASLTYEVISRRLIQRGVDDQGKKLKLVVFDNLKPRDGVVKIRFLIDRLSVESSRFGGERFFANYHSPQNDEDPPSIQSPWAVDDSS